MNPIDKHIARLAIPSMVSNITVPLLGLVDLSIVGHLGQAEQIGAIAIGSTVFNMLYWIFAFLRMGTTGLTSQAHGAKRKDECATLLLRSLLFGMIISLILCALQSPLLALTSAMMSPSANVAPFFNDYFSICIWGAPAMLCSYTLTGWFIGMQNTRIPMFVAIVQNVINIVLSLFFVLSLNWGLKGVALGTVLGLYGGVAISVIMAIRLWRKEHLSEPNWGTLLDKKGIMKFLGVNSDIFFRTLCLVSVMSFFTYAGSHQNDNILGGNALLMEFFMLYSFFMDGLANAAEALSGEFHGAKDTALLKGTIRRLFAWSILLAVIFTLVYIMWGVQLLELLTNQPSVVMSAWHYLPWIWSVPIISIMAFVWDGVFIGLCWSRQMLISMAIATIVFFAIYFTCFPFLNNHALWMAFCSYLFTRGLVQTFISINFSKRHSR